MARKYQRDKLGRFASKGGGGRKAINSGTQTRGRQGTSRGNDAARDAVTLGYLRDGSKERSQADARNSRRGQQHAKRQNNAVTKSIAGFGSKLNKQAANKTRSQARKIERERKIARRKGAMRPTTRRRSV
jgi:hypothetical protein